METTLEQRVKDLEKEMELSWKMTWTMWEILFEFIKETNKDVGTIRARINEEGLGKYLEDWENVRSGLMTLKSSKRTWKGRKSHLSLKSRRKEVKPKK